MENSGKGKENEFATFTTRNKKKTIDGNLECIAKYGERGSLPFFWSLCSFLKGERRRLPQVTVAVPRSRLPAAFLLCFFVPGSSSGVSADVNRQRRTTPRSWAELSWGEMRDGMTPIRLTDRESGSLAFGTWDQIELGFSLICPWIVTPWRQPEYWCQMLAFFSTSELVLFSVAGPPSVLQTSLNFRYQGSSRATRM